MTSKNFSSNIDLAADFFSKIEEQDFAEEKLQKKNKKRGGRPKKIGLKNMQFTLTMDPKLYEKLKIVAQERHRGNFSELVYNAVNVYCLSNNIDLDQINIAEDILDKYVQKQKNGK